MVQDINFFSPYTGKKKEAFNKNIYIYSLVGTMATAIVGTFIWNSVSISMVNKEIANFEAELSRPEIAEKIAESEVVNKKLDILNRYENGLNEIYKAVESREVVSTGLLNMISSTLPTEVSFNSINITNTDIAIQAVSDNRTAIAEVQYNLKQLPNVQDVYIGAITGEEKFNFDIKCVLKDVE